MLTTTFPGITSNTPEMLVPMALIAAPFAICAVVGMFLNVRDWLFRRG